MRLVFLVISLFFLVGQAEAKPVVQYDSSEVELRQIEKKDLAKYRAQEEFNYKEAEQAVSVWDRFWNWFWMKVDSLFKKKGVQRGVDIAIWILAILVVAYAIYRFAGMEKLRLFREAGSNDIAFRPSDEDVRTMDLPAAIAEAEGKADYRLALRLQYLYSLRQLSDRNIISYAINKTNHDYARELSGGPYAMSFSRITMLYEFGWYGEFPVDKDMYDRIRDIFIDHRKSIQP